MLEDLPATDFDIETVTKYVNGWLFAELPTYSGPCIKIPILRISDSWP